jgi:GTPase SAR1 family protein
MNNNLRNPSTEENDKSKVRDLRIIYPRINLGLQRIKECQDSRSVHPEARGLILTGPSGVGKTTVANLYIGKSESKNILMFSMPSPLSPKSFFQELLRCMGDAYPRNGTVQDKMNRSIGHLKGLKYELVIIDEAQHLFDPRGRSFDYETSECIKLLLNQTNIPAVLIGTERVSEIKYCDPQLGKRFSQNFELRPFSYDNDLREREWLRLLEEIDNGLPISLNPKIREKEMAHRIFSVTAGFMDKLMLLIRTATVEAIKDGKSRIECSDFKIAFEKHYLAFSGQPNPFMD